MEQSYKQKAKQTIQNIETKNQKMFPILVKESLSAYIPDHREQSRKI